MTPQIRALIEWQAAAPYRTIELVHRFPRECHSFPTAPHFASATEKRDDGSWVAYGQSFATTLEEAARLALKDLELDRARRAGKEEP